MLLNIVKSVFFADDTCLFIAVDDSELAAEQIINAFDKWSKDWLVSFSPSKTESMIISNKINTPNHPPMYWQNIEINNVSQHKSD